MMKSDGGGTDGETLQARVSVLEELLESKERVVAGHAAKLEEALAQSRFQASLLRALVAATDPSHQHEFFHAMVYHLAAALHVPYAVIGEFDAIGESASRVETIAVWAGGDFAANFTYELSGMPCAGLVQERLVCCEDGVRERFPQAQLMKDLSAEGYVGLPLYGSTGKPIGMLALLDTKPLRIAPEAQAVLALFAARAGSEIDRRRLETAHATSQQNLQNIMNTVPDVLFTLDLQGNLTQWNSQAEKVTGYTSEELAGKHALTFVPPEESEQTIAAITQALTTGHAELEGHVVTKDRRIIAYHWTGAALKDSEGRVIGISGVGRDVSEQRRVQEEAAYQRRQLVHAQALAHLGSLDWDIDSGDVQWSDEQFRIFGHEPGAIRVTYDTVLASLFPEDHDRVLAGLNDALIGKRPYDIEYRIVRPSGEVRTVHSRGEVLRDAAGHPLRMAGATLDITERQQVEEALRLSEERWQLAVRGSNDGIWDWNVQTGEVFFSARWKTMRGFGEHELADHLDEWRSRIHPDDLDRVIEKVEAYLAKTAGEFCEEYRVLRKDGSYIWILDRGVALWDEQGTPIRMVGSESDITERKRAEQALQLSEQHIKSIIEASPECIKLVASDGTLLQMNAAGLAMIEAERVEDAIGKCVYPLIVPEHRDRFRALNESVCQGANASMEFELEGLRGTRRWMDTHAVPLRNPADGAMVLLAITRDISDRKKAEEALSAALRNLQSIAETIPDIMYKLDQNGNVIDWNRRVWSITGYTEEEMRLKPALALVPEDDRPRLAAAMRRVFETGFAEVECCLLTKDGRTIPYHWSGAVLKDLDGRVIGMTGVGRDITPLKQAETAVRESEARYKALVELLPAGVFVFCEGRTAYINQSGAAIMGAQTPDQILERDTFDFVHPDYRAEVKHNVHRLLTGGAAVHRAERLYLKLDGTPIPVQVEAAPIIWNGKPAILGIFSDITERKRAEEALATSERQLRTVLDTLPVGVWFTDATGKVVLSNPAGRKIWSGLAGIGIERSEHQPGWRERIGDAEEPHRWALTRVLLQGDARLNETIEIECEDGSHKVINNSAVPVKNHAGCVTGAIVVNEDITDRTRGEESRAKLAAIVTSSYDAIMSLSLEGEIQSWNLGAEVMFGYAAEEMLGGPVTVLTATGKHGGLTAALQRAAGGDPIHHLDMTLCAKNGEEIFASLNVSPIVPQRGTVTSISLIARNVTDQRLAEMALQASEELFSKTFRSSPNPIGITDMETGRCIDVNDACLELFGYRREDVIGQTTLMLGIWPNPEDRAKLIARLKAGGPERNIEMSVRIRSGEIRHVLVSSDLVEMNGRRCLVTVGSDITERKRVEEALKKSHAFIRQVIDIDPNFIFAKDREGRFTLVNKAVADCYGTTADELIGKSDADFNPVREEVEFFRQKDLEVMDTLRERFISEEQITDSTGRVRWLQTVKRPILDERGEAVMVLGAATDITERKRMEEALRQRERDLQEALDERERISQDLHDGILQSLYAVGLGIESCRPWLTKDPEKALQACDQAVAQLNNIMREVRGFIAGIDPHSLDSLDLREALRSMVESMTQARAMRVRLALSKQAAGAISRDKAMHLLNVVKEAVSNTIRHGHATQATVSLKRVKQGVRLSIQDDGAGFRQDRITRGRGLDNMANRANKMGGRLTVQSKPKFGTRITVDLPAESPYAHA